MKDVARKLSNLYFHDAWCVISDALKETEEDGRTLKRSNVIEAENFGKVDGKVHDFILSSNAKGKKGKKTYHSAGSN